MKFLLKKPGTDRPRRGLLVAAVAVVIILLGTLGILFFKHYVDRKIYLTERNFRVLGQASRSLTEALGNYEIVFESIIEGAKTNSSYEIKDACSGKTARLFKSMIEKKLASALCSFPDLTSVNVSWVETVSTSSSPTRRLKVSLADSLGEPKFLLDYGNPPMQVLTAEIPVAKLLGRLPTEEIFTDLLLATGLGDVFYARSAAGVRISNIRVPTESDHKDKKTDKQDFSKSDDKKKESAASEYPQLLTRNIGPIEYSLFVHPVTLPSLSSEVGLHKGRLFLIGVISARTFRSDALAIPSGLILVMTSLILLAFCALPYIKLATMDQRDRLRTLDVLAVMFFSILATALLTLIIVDAYSIWHVNETLDHQLESAATAISQNVKSQLHKAVTYLSSFDDFCKSSAVCKNALQPSQAPLLLPFGVKSGSQPLLVLSDTLKFDMTQFAINSLFIVSEAGFNQVSWSATKPEWGYLNLNERRYVKVLREGIGENCPSTDYQCYLQPIYSWTTAQNFAVLARVSQIRPLSSENKPIISALEFELSALMTPVVPPGFGFAIVDPGGTVLFHSDPRRNLRENIFAETDNNPRIKAIVYSRSKNFANANYLGIPRKFFVGPLADIPSADHWSLLVYRNDSVLKTANLEAIFLATTLFCLFAGLVIGLGVFMFLILLSLKNGHGEWIWPDPRRKVHYYVIAAVNISLLLIYGIVQSLPSSSVSDEANLFVATILIIVGIIVMYAVLKNPRRSGDVSLSPRLSLSHRKGYSLMVMTFMLLFAVMPSFACFKVSFNRELYALIKSSYYGWELKLRDRRNEVSQAYSQMGFDGTSRGNLINNRIRITDDLYPQFITNVNMDAWYLGSEKIGSLYDSSIIASVHQMLRVLFSKDSTESDGFVYSEALNGNIDKVTASALTALFDNLRIPDSLFWFFIALPLLFVPHTLSYRPSFSKLYEANERQTNPDKNFAAFTTVLNGTRPVLLITCLLVASFPFKSPALATLYLITGVSLISWLLLALPRFAGRCMFLLDYPRECTTRRNERGNPFLPNCWLPPHVAAMLGNETEFNPKIQEVVYEKLSSHMGLQPSLSKIQDLHVLEDVLLKLVLHEARAAYVELWSRCAQTEKLALYNLARDRFLNTNNPAIESLLHKGLITLKPDLKLMNETFRRFVLAQSTEEHLEAHDVHTTESNWSQLWRPVGAGLVLIVLFLMSTQEELRTVTLAFFTMLPAVLPALPKLFGSPPKLESMK